MTENGKPKIDFLKWWLWNVTIFSGLIFFIVGYALITDFIRHFIEFCYIVLTPIMLFFSWKHCQRDKRGISILFSVILVIISSFMLLFYRALLLLAGGGTGW